MSSSPVRAYILDSFALLAYLEDEVGAAAVQEKLQAAANHEMTLYLSAINLGEMMGIIEREQGLPAAQLALAQIQQLPIHHLEATLSRILAASHIKAHHAISYADAFAVAAAQEQQAILLTGDPEFGKVAASIAIEWLARN